MISLDDIRCAHAKLRQDGGAVFAVTPVVESVVLGEALSRLVGREISVCMKCENLQPVGSFKIRGALNFALTLTDQERTCGIITHSSGNHGIAVAAAGNLLGIPSVVVVPTNAPADKLTKIRSYGGEIVECEPTLQSRQETCSQISSERGMTEIPPFDHRKTIVGQGTIALEILDQVPDVDAVVAAVGGCGMISGVATVMKSATPRRIAVIGAEPCAVDDTIQSLKEGTRRGPTDPTKVTICDALRVSPPGVIPFEIVKEKVDTVVGVEDQAVIEAMRALWDSLQIVTEPSGACALAGLFTQCCLEFLTENAWISKVCVIVCGSNISSEEFHRYVACQDSA